ncbi:MAG TPA: hypothetical protein VF211_07320 [Burkholderiales bacterium]
MKALAALALAALALPAAAQDAVTVRSLRDPVDKSYRRMLEGRALFDRLHAMAPRAELRYRLLPRRPDTDMRDVTVSVVGDSFERPVRVPADRTFSLERDRRAWEEDASVRPNRKAGTLTWRADIRTPGLPPNVRRLGDLRLECRVGMKAELVSHYPSLFDRFMDFLIGTERYCDQKEPSYLFFAERPLFAVTLVHGERRETLSVGALYAGLAHDRAPTTLLPHCDCAALLDRAYFVPLGDRSWPDDTRVELEYMDAPASDADYASLAGSRKAEILEMFGRAKRIRFADGHEVWTYEYGPGERRLAQTEVVVLFDPAGVVAKARLRPGIPAD